eukprot:TRINITY_DN100_c7_g1_i1.p1 TRINITY_DN100_c7_g1~~TRINITY_DN100_c7_g1_i1.p1  ORF type:complete len:164 (+),score=21.69 TRINITY_DN100_c7_g1_i1:47-538(+)
MTDCFAHPGLAATTIAQKPVGQPLEVSSHATHRGKTNSDLSGIEMPNPKLRVYSNGLGDTVCYPLNIPVEKKSAGAIPDAKLYQRATRRPWDITTQQYSRQLNKRLAWSMFTTGILVGVLFPLWPTHKPTVDSGPRPLLGLSPTHGTFLTAPKNDRSFAGVNN